MLVQPVKSWMWSRLLLLLLLTQSTHVCMCGVCGTLNASSHEWWLCKRLSSLQERFIVGLLCYYWRSLKTRPPQNRLFQKRWSWLAGCGWHQPWVNLSGRRERHLLCQDWWPLKGRWSFKGCLCQKRSLLRAQVIRWLLQERLPVSVRCLLHKVYGLVVVHRYCWMLSVSRPTKGVYLRCRPYILLSTLLLMLHGMVKTRSTVCLMVSRLVDRRWLKMGGRKIR